MLRNVRSQLSGPLFYVRPATNCLDETSGASSGARYALHCNSPCPENALASAPAAAGSSNHSSDNRLCAALGLSLPPSTAKNQVVDANRIGGERSERRFREREFRLAIPITSSDFCNLF